MMNNKKITFSNEEYEGYHNVQIDLAYEKLKTCNELQQSIENEIKHIQDMCNHQYKLCCRGPYENDYCCELCGKTISKK